MICQPRAASGTHPSERDACVQEAVSWRDFRASLVHQERAGLFTIDDSSRWKTLPAHPVTQNLPSVILGLCDVVGIVAT